MARHTFSCIDGHTCGNPVRLVSGGGPLLKGSNMMERRADFLANHPKIERISYPFHPSHPQYELAQRQMASGSTLVAMEVKGGREAAFRLSDSLAVILISNNLGDAKSLITHPGTTTHARFTEDVRLEAGITPGLLRLSVGLEDADDRKPATAEPDRLTDAVVADAEPRRGTGAEDHSGVGCCGRVEPAPRGDPGADRIEQIEVGGKYRHAPRLAPGDALAAIDLAVGKQTDGAYRLHAGDAAHHGNRLGRHGRRLAEHRGARAGAQQVGAELGKKLIELGAAR